jgi:arginase
LLAVVHDADRECPSGDSHPVACGAFQEYDSEVVTDGMEDMDSSAGYIQRPPSLLDLPFDEASSFMRGAAEAPSAIRKALRCDSSNMWTESGIDLSATGAYHDSGYIQPGPLSDPDEMLDLISDGARRVIDDGFAPVFLGGDHAITYPAFAGLAERISPVSILHFDAHPDLYDKFRGDRLSHACPFARIMEEGLARRLVQVGIRSANGHQLEQAERFGVEMITMKDLGDAAALSFEEPLYISFDVDVLDPAFAPGVSHPEPGGLTTRDAISIIQSVRAPFFAGADMVEYNPAMDARGMTAMVCAKILKELLARFIP